MKKLAKARVPPAPRGLSAAARKWWARINETYILDDGSRLILESAMQSLDRWQEAKKLVDEEGLVVRDRFNQPKPHPATLTERDSKALMVRSLKSLGLDLEPLHDRAGRPPGT